MNWEMIGAIAEAMGAVAVVATLLYLAMQVKQNTIASRISAKQEMTKQFADYIDTLLDPKIDAVYRKGNDGEELNEEERRLYSRLMSKQAWYFAAMHFQYSKQALDEDDWRQSYMMIYRACIYPGFISWWSMRRSDFDPSFTAFVDTLIEEGDPLGGSK